MSGRLPVGALLIWGLAAGGCGDDLQIGLSGCDGGGSFSRAPENTVAGGAHVALTAAGADLLIAQRELLAGLLLDVDPDGWVQLPLPAFDFGQQGVGLGVGIRDMVVAFDLRAADIELGFLADPTRMRLTVRRARIKLVDGVVWITVGGDAACRLGNGLAPNTPAEALLEADLTVDVQLAVDASGRLDVQVEVLPFTVHGLDFELLYDRDLPECADGLSAAECRLACGAGDLAIDLAEALYNAFAEQLNAVLSPAIQVIVDALVARFTEDPIAIAGALHPRLLADLLPTAVDAHPIAFGVAPSPEGFTLRSAGAEGDGLGLTTDVGFDTVDHPCVPPVDSTPRFVAGPAPVLSGYDHAGQVYHLGLSLAAASVNRVTWVAYRAGVLCAALDTGQIEALLGQRVDTSTLALVLPGLSELSLGARPVRVALDPRFVPSDLPLARFFPVPDAGGVPQAGIALNLPRLGLSFYGLVEERWTRLFAAEVSLAVDIVVQATPDDRLSLTVGTPEVGGVRETYNELLSGADVPALLDLVTDLLTSALLRDGLTFDVGLAGLVADLTGLPLEARIAALRVEGEGDDFLSVLISLGVRGGAGLTGAVDTMARVEAVRPGEVDLAVEATARDARYQWRLGEGPWRPLEAAPGGRLVVRAPGLRLLGDHRLAVRAVAAADYRTLDPTPAEVVVRVEPLGSWAPPLPRGGGCAAAPGGAGGAALLLLLLLGRRRRWALAVGLALFGCDDKRAAADPPCATSADCPGGLLCFDDRCRRPDACERSAECCPSAECRGGLCVPGEADCAVDADCGDPLLICELERCTHRPCGAGCPEGLCVEGRCHREPPCQGRCAPEEVCFGHLDVCRRAPPACAAACGPGEVRVVRSPEAYEGPLCEGDEAECACAAAPAIAPADFGRHASMILVGGEAEFAAWDADFGDLVYVTGVEGGAPVVRYLDGVPPGAPQADPTGPRGGVTTPGPDRGRYVSLAVDPKGRPHMAYYDADAGALRYLRGDGAGGFLPPVVLDAAGDAGRYPALAIDGLGHPHLLYHWWEGGQAGIRYAFGAQPESIDPGDFEFRDLSARPAGEPPPPGVVPAAHGVRPCSVVGLDGRVYAAWYDGAERWPYIARGGPEGFEVRRLEGARAADWPADPGGRYERLAEHDLGRFCAVAVGIDTITLLLTDATTDALLAWRGTWAAGPGTFELVDPGGAGVRRLVGADPALALDGQGTPVAVYQDATENDVLMAVRTADGWQTLTVATAGALGFHNGLIVREGEAIVGTLELRTTAVGRGAHRLHVYRLDVPRF